MKLIILSILLSVTCLAQTLPISPTPSCYWVGHENPDSLFAFYMKFPPGVDSVECRFLEFSGKFTSLPDGNPIFEPALVCVAQRPADSCLIVIPGLHHPSYFHLQWRLSNVIPKTEWSDIMGFLTTPIPVQVNPPNGVTNVH